MSFKVAVTEPTRVPEGIFNGKSDAVEITAGPHGPMARWEFVLSGDEVDGKRVSGLTGTVADKETKLGKWAGALLGRELEVGEVLTEDLLVGKQCRVRVEHRDTGDGKSFSNATDVLPQVEPE